VAAAGRIETDNDRHAAEGDGAGLVAKRRSPYISRVVRPACLPRVLNPASNAALPPDVISEHRMLRDVFEEALNAHRRLRYSVRGPEWAFVIPHGDMDALEDVMQRCSGFWNGAGSLIIPIRRSGWTPSWVDYLLETRSVDLTWIHEAVDQSLRERIREKLGQTGILRDNFDRDETHPLRLAAADQRLGRLTIPAKDTAVSRTLALALWGHINEPDLPYYQERYEISEAQPGASNWKALVDGQIDGPVTSPLRIAQTGMDMIWSGGSSEYPYLWVFGARPSFSAVVEFWNFRARLIARAAGAPVLGLPYQTLGSEGALASLGEWLHRRPGYRSTPDCFVSCTDSQAQLVEQALATAHIVPETSSEYKFQFGNDVVANSPPTFARFPLHLWGPFQRGLVSTQLVTIVDGRTALVLPAPAGFHVRDLSHVRLTMHDLPLVMPATPTVADSVIANAVPGDGGIRITTSAMGEWNLDVSLPPAARALTDWATDRGFEIEPTREAMDAEAILKRVGSLDGLDVLANAQRIELLERLAPLASGKLAQRLVAELKKLGEIVNEDAINEQLASMSLFLELRGRTAAELAALMGVEIDKKTVLRLLPELVSGGFVRRAREVTCPECRYRTLLGLDEQGEVVRCRACEAEYPLPVVDVTGTKEPDVVYRLDGLMARGMSQDIVPVLLALRAFAKSRPLGGSFAAWPGLLFKERDGSRRVEVDLVVSFGGTVFCCEVKKTAHTLKDAQLRDLLELCARLQARPAIAALNGDFPVQHGTRITDLGGRVLDGRTLLAAIPEVRPPVAQQGTFAGLVTQSGVWR
jgi:hypothetical protein